MVLSSNVFAPAHALAALLGARGWLVDSTISGLWAHNETGKLVSFDNQTIVGARGELAVVDGTEYYPLTTANIHLHLYSDEVLVDNVDFPTLTHLLEALAVQFDYSEPDSKGVRAVQIFEEV